MWQYRVGIKKMAQIVPTLGQWPNLPEPQLPYLQGGISVDFTGCQPWGSDHPLSLSFPVCKT